MTISKEPPVSPTGRLLADICEPMVRLGRGEGLDGLCVSRALDQHFAGVMYASDARASQLDDLQETLGEGPGCMAMRQRSPVLVSDLASDACAASWVGFQREATTLGVGSMFAFPIQLGVVGLGLMTMHATRPLTLAEPVVRALVGVSDTLAGAILHLRPVDGSPIQADTGADGAGPGPGLPDDLVDLLDSGRLVTHQAVGMVSVQLDTTLEQAMVALRARAYADGVAVADLAREVVSRRIRLSAEIGNPADKDENGSSFESGVDDE